MSTTSAGLPSPSRPVSIRSVLPAGLTKLLWELRDAYEANSGETVAVTRLLLDRDAFIEFVTRASRCNDQRVGDAVARIRAIVPDLVASASGIEEGTGQPAAVSMAEETPAAVLASGQALEAAPEPGLEASSATSSEPSHAEINAELQGLLERLRRAEASPPPSSPPPSGSPFERARTIAGFVAAVLLSLVAARQLLTDPSRPGATPSLRAAEIVSAAPAAVVTGTPEHGASTAKPATAETDPTANAADPAAALFRAQATTALRIHGSNTVGERLMPNLVEAFLRSRGAPLAVAKKGSVAEEKEVRARVPGSEGVIAVDISAHGSTTAFTDLAAGSATIGQSSRRIKPEERDALLEKDGDLTLPGAEHVLALDGVAVIVHPSSGVASLGLGQVARIFSGEVKDWSEVGGRPGPIHLVARDDKSGTWDTFRSLVLSPTRKELPPSASRLESSGELVQAVAADPAAIGFVGLPYVRDDVRALPLSADDGGLALLPTPFTVGTEDYPLSRRLYLYTPTSHDDAWARDFVEFALSDAGQRVVADSGFVSQAPRPEKVRMESFQPAAYRALAGEAERLSVNFRFESGRDVLDNKAVRDLDRLVHWLVANPSRQVVLLGFTDASGDSSRNTALSLQRARSVERELVTRGIRPADVRGFGQALPVATNATEDGRNRNRRVEVWVR